LKRKKERRKERERERGGREEGRKQFVQNNSCGEWRCGSRGRVSALQGQSPQFKTPCHQKIKITVVIE
jgi:hypothetical protein